MTKKARALLKERRFLPYFVTQSLGAFNDNIYKNTLLILVAFAAPGSISMSTDLFINLAAALFILPFFLFSAFAGELTDKFEKSRLIRVIKMAEILIMVLAAIAFIYEQYGILLFLLFLMGTQSAFFGPVKYALLPQTLTKNELVAGNAVVEAGTFLAILFGTLVAGFIAEHSKANELAAALVIFFAVCGYVSARYIPESAANDPHLRIRFSPIRQIKTTLAIAHQDKDILKSILGSSWFWFLGTCYLTQFPNYAKLYLGGSESSVSFLLVLFSIGISLGAIACNKLSFGRIELGIIPIGALGMTFFGIDLFFSTPQSAQASSSLGAFVSQTSLWWVFFDLLMIGFFASLFIVPLYAYIQAHSKPKECAQVIAALNIYNALFMVTAAILGIICLSIFNFSIPEFFLIIALLNLAISLYSCKKLALYMARFIAWVISHSFYRVTPKRLDEIPEKGGALLICNHVSYMDALLLAGACKRPIRFIMWADLYKLPLLHYFFKAGKVIPISDQKTQMRAALKEAKKQLTAGELVCIFPEGELSPNGELGEFKRGVELILKQSPVPVIPLALKGLWGSYFCREGGRALLKCPKRFRSRITLIAGESIEADKAKTDLLHQKISQLLEE